MPKKIAFIGPIPPPIGGVALANIEVQRLTRENNANATILNYNTSRGLENADLYKRKGITEFLHFVRNIYGVIKLAITHKITVANVFVVPNISFIREAVFIFILKIMAKKVVIHLHAKTGGDFFLEGKKLRIFTKILSLGDVIFVLSEKFHKQFYKKYIKDEKLVVLENFVEYANFENRISDKSRTFLYVGRLSEKKGFLTLVEAISLIKNESLNLKIDVLGAFENDCFQEKIEFLLKKHDIRCFHFHGPKMGEEKYKYFKQNSVFIFPSYFENSPIVLKEAIAAKMAIISSDITENKNILDPFENKLYFKAKSAKDLALQIKSLASDWSCVCEMMHNSEKITQFDTATARAILNEHI